MLPVDPFVLLVPSLSIQGPLSWHPPRLSSIARLVRILLEQVILQREFTGGRVIQQEIFSLIWNRSAFPLLRGVEVIFGQNAPVARLPT